MLHNQGTSALLDNSLQEQGGDNSGPELVNLALVPPRSPLRRASSFCGSHHQPTRRKRGCCSEIRKLHSLSRRTADE
jgi:hypothetical protein